MRNVRELLAQIERDGLLVPSCWTKDEGALQKVYNGCGPDWLPAPVRKWLTSHFSFFEAAFLIHDWEFAQKDKSLDSFHGANSRLHANCWRLVTRNISKFNFPKRILYYARCHEIYFACEQFGKSAWMD